MAKNNRGISKLLILVLVAIISVAGTGVICFSGLFNEKEEKWNEEDWNNDEIDFDSFARGKTVKYPAFETAKLENPTGRTIMVYIIGSNLETDYQIMSQNIKQMKEVSMDHDCNIIIQTGGSKKWHTRGIKDEKVQRFLIKDGKLTELANLGKKSMVKSSTLTDFVKYSAESFPAEDYVLIFADHGGSIPISFGLDEMYSEEMLSDYELDAALDKAGVHFESIIFDCCEMSTLEVAMAMKEHTDYMVAGESETYGIDGRYVGLLKLLGDADSAPVDYCKSFIDDSKKAIESYNAVSTIALIDLKKIDAVYDAFEKYIISCEKSLDLGAYAEFSIARNNSGWFNGTSTVDVIELASNFKNEYSDELISATKDAIIYSYEGVQYGHGLGVYCPGPTDQYEFGYYYKARNSLDELGYSNEIINFFDEYVSLIYAYYNIPTNDDWYDDDYVKAHYEDITVTVDDDEIPANDMGDYYAIILDEQDWSIISSVEMSIFFSADDKTYYSVGSIFGYITDDNGNLKYELPKSWLTINGNAAFLVPVDMYEAVEGNGYTYVYGCPAKVNGEGALLIAYIDNEHPKGTILGYMKYDFDTEENDSELLMIEEDDKIVTMAAYVDDSEGLKFVESGDWFYARDIVIEYSEADWDGVKVYEWYRISDVYGNSYDSELIEL